MADNLFLQVSAGRVADAFKRFWPVPVFCAMVAVVLCMDVHGWWAEHERWEAFCVGWPLGGSVLALALRLWSETETAGKKVMTVRALAHLLWINVAAWMFLDWHGGEDECMAVLSTAVLMVVAVLTVPFLRDKDDTACRRFTLRMAVALCVAGLLTLLFMGGVTLLIEFVQNLFGLRVPAGVVSDVVVVSLTLVAPVVFLLFVPSVETIRSGGSNGLPPAAYMVVRWLLLPLLLLYVVVLYAYGAVILFTWTLPDGNVSYMVTTMMAGMLGFIGIMHPSGSGEVRRMERLAVRMLPLLALPLLFLMTVGIARRIGDYGLTPLRLYAAMLNVWFYGVCHYLFWHGSRRFSWVAVSFAVVFFLVSVGPQSFYSLLR